ncbi:unnamed protein product, partial [Sphacelaria rigidula]
MAAAEQSDHKATISEENTDDEVACVAEPSETATIRSSVDGLDLGPATVEQRWSNSTGLAETQQLGDGLNPGPLSSKGGGRAEVDGGSPEMSAMETRNSNQ